jgi:hypothetical protein
VSRGKLLFDFFFIENKKENDKKTGGDNKVHQE